jgi:peptidoglycan-N-acetylglucosamine deacetylase
MLRLILLTSIWLASVPGYTQESRSQPQPGTQWSEEQLKQAVAPMRAGRKLTPASWPNGARVAVCLSWDMDNESFDLAAGNTAPIRLSQGEYGTRQALPRILGLHDRHGIPGTFYVPAVVGLLYPQLVTELKKRPQHEVGVHGWVHENVLQLNDRAEERRLLHQAIDFWTKALGTKPVGYRAPYWAFSAYTLDLIREAGFEYDSSALAMDEPYEIIAHGKPTGLIELPASWITDDAPYLVLPGGALPSPNLVFQVYQDDFDGAYREGTLFMLTLHPMFMGQRSRIVYLDKLIVYMKSKPGVWFATAQQIADYVKQDSAKRGRSDD